MVARRLGGLGGQDPDQGRRVLGQFRSLLGQAPGFGAVAGRHGQEAARQGLDALLALGLGAGLRAARRGASITQSRPRHRMVAIRAENRVSSAAAAAVISTRQPIQSRLAAAGLAGQGHHRHGDGRDQEEDDDQAARIMERPATPGPGPPGRRPGWRRCAVDLDPALGRGQPGRQHGRAGSAMASSAQIAAFDVALVRAGAGRAPAWRRAWFPGSSRPGGSRRCWTGRGAGGPGSRRPRPGCGRRRRRGRPGLRTRRPGPPGSARRPRPGATGPAGPATGAAPAPGWPAPRRTGARSGGVGQGGGGQGGRAASSTPFCPASSETMRLSSRSISAAGVTATGGEASMGAGEPTGARRPGGVALGVARMSLLTGLPSIGNQVGPNRVTRARRGHARYAEREHRPEARPQQGAAAGVDRGIAGGDDFSGIWSERSYAIRAPRRTRAQCSSYRKGDPARRFRWRPRRKGHRLQRPSCRVRQGRGHGRRQAKSPQVRRRRDRKHRASARAARGECSRTASSSARRASVSGAGEHARPRRPPGIGPRRRRRPAGRQVGGGLAGAGVQNQAGPRFGQQSGPGPRRRRRR
jgi:hypothetical protein